MISTAHRVILFLSLTTPGTVHDFEQIRQNFDPDQDWFKNLQIIIDLGYLGFDKTYTNCEVLIPKRKKPRRGKNLHLSEEELLTEEDKAHNKMVSQKRVWVEHAIGGIKRFFCLVHKWRNRIPEFQDAAILIAAGIWNLHLGVHFK